MGHGLGAYNIPNFRLRSYGVYTNKIYVGSYRASGVADMTFAVESHTDNIARELGMDSWDFRMKNALKEGDTSVNGAKIPRNGLAESLLAVKERLGTAQEAGRVPRCGLGGLRMAQRQWPLHGCHQLERRRHGQLADRLGGHLRQRHLAGRHRRRDAEDCPWAMWWSPKEIPTWPPSPDTSGGSRIVYSQGTAVLRAAEEVRERLYELAAERLGVPAGALATGDGGVYVHDNPNQQPQLQPVGRHEP